jgi:hypothetical protein
MTAIRESRIEPRSAQISWHIGSAPRAWRTASKRGKRPKRGTERRSLGEQKKLQKSRLDRDRRRHMRSRHAFIARVGGSSDLRALNSSGAPPFESVSPWLAHYGTSGEGPVEIQSARGMAQTSFRKSGVAESGGRIRREEQREGTKVNVTVLGIERCTRKRGLSSLRQSGQNVVARAHGKEASFSLMRCSTLASLPWRRAVVHIVRCGRSLPKEQEARSMSPDMYGLAC